MESCFLKKDFIPIRYLYTEGKPIQAFFFKLNLHKKKWPLSCSSDPYRNNIARHLEAFRQSLDLYSAIYENIIQLGDFKLM